MNQVLVQFINILAYALWLSILARVIVSWFPLSGQNIFVAFIYQITEPILAPLRRIIPKFGMLDFTPMIAIVIIIVIQRFLIRVIGG